MCWGTHWFLGFDGFVSSVLVECVGYPLVLGFDGFVGSVLVDPLVLGVL